VTDKDLKLDPAWRQAVEDAQRLYGFGEAISKEWLMEAFELAPARTVEDADRLAFEWLQSYIPFRDSLLEKYKKCLRPLPRVGYEVVEPAQQTDYGKRRFQSGVKREYERYRSTVVNIQLDELTQAQMQHNAEEQAKLAHINIFISSEIEGRKRAAIADAHDKDD